MAEVGYHLSDSRWTGLRHLDHTQKNRSHDRPNSDSCGRRYSRHRFSCSVGYHSNVGRTPGAQVESAKRWLVVRRRAGENTGAILSVFSALNVGKVVKVE